MAKNFLAEYQSLSLEMAGDHRYEHNVCSLLPSHLAKVESFECPLLADGLRNPNIPYTGVFIRAPVRVYVLHPIARCIDLTFPEKVLLALHPSTQNPPIEIIARLPPNLLPKSQKATACDEGDDPQSIVAVRQGRHMLTTFHPELTKDNRFHEYFVRTCVLPTLL